MRSWIVTMVGAPAVGKTSLVERYIDNIFRPEMEPTYGMKLSRKIIDSHPSPAELMLWDLAGEGEYLLSEKYPERAAGMQDRKTSVSNAYILVADVSRRATLEEAISRQERIDRAHERKIPFVLALNKSDLSEKEFDEADARRAVGDWQIVSTSAKTGQGVIKMFDMVADALFKYFGLP